MIRFLVGTYVFIWRLITSYFPYGTNIYDREWELVVVLDSCRIDALQQVADEYEFLSEIETITSVGSTSPEWIDNTFIEEHINDIRSTSYITANAYSERHVKKEGVNRLRCAETRGTIYENSELLHKLIRNDSVGGEFASFKLVEGAKLTNADNRQYFHPDLVTARAIQTARERNPKKMIVHYMQPHAPYIADAVGRGFYKEYEERPFKYLKQGGKKSVVWEVYLDNLRLVLDSIEILLNNIDAEDVVITADHGELFGEFGLYSHIYGVPHPALKKVPWTKTTAKDKHTTNVEELISDHEIVENDDNSTESRLAALGYLS